MWLYDELKRRNVIRVATAYVVAAWLAVQVVETVLPAFGFTDRAVRIVVILFAIGFVPAVIGAWVFQVTPDGLVRDRGAAEGETGSPAAARNLDRAIIVLLVLGISYFAVDKFVLAPERAAEREAEIAERARMDAELGYYGNRSIAVLPFDNLSSDPEQQYFVDGVAEEILNLLARIRELRVISRSSSFNLRDTDLAIPAIAERLNVGYVLEGSVRRVGNRVRVTAQLIEGRTDMHLWSQTYERTLGDVFVIQDEIAADVARNLELEITGQLPKSRYVDPEALALTQQAKQIAERRPPDVGQKMHVLLSQALEIDPDYLPALEWMVTANFFRKLEGRIDEEEEKALYARIEQAILAVEPESAFIDALNAWVAGSVGRYEEAARLYERSLSKSVSNSNSVRLAGVFARHIGRFDVATRLHEHSVAIDPLCYQCLYHLSRDYLYVGDYEKSIEIRERYLALGRGGQYHYGLTLLLLGDYSQALEHYLGMTEDHPQSLAGIAMARHALGDTDGADAAFAKLVQGPEHVTAEFAVDVAAWRHDRDLAFEWLDRYVSTVDRWDTVDVYNPAWRSLHDDPRWTAFRERIGMSAARLDAIEFDPTLPE